MVALVMRTVNWFFCRLAAHIRCPDLLLVDDTKGGVGNVVGDGVKAGGYKLNIARYSGN